MSLVTIESVLEFTQVDDVDVADRVMNHALGAEERMRELLTYDEENGPYSVPDPATGVQVGNMYEDIVALEDPFDESDKEQLKRAETKYALGDAIPMLGLRMADDGGFVQSTGFDQSRTNYKSFGETKQYATELQSQAIRLASGLRRVDDQEPVWVL